MNFSWDFILAIEKCTVYYVVSIRKKETLYCMVALN